MPALAARAGIHEATLRHRIELGAPEPPQSGAARSVDAWVRRFQKWTDAHKATKASEHRPTNQHDKTPEAARHQEEWQKWRAAEARLRVARETRQVVSRKEVVEFASSAILTVRQRLNAMVMKMTSRLANVPDHVVAEELQIEVDDICNGFAGGMKRVADLVAIDGRCPLCRVQAASNDTT